MRIKNSYFLKGHRAIGNALFVGTIAVLVVALASVGVFAYLRVVSLQSDNTSLQTQISSLQSSISQLQSNYQNLQSLYNQLNTSFDQLNASYDQLNASYSQLNDQYRLLLSRIRASALIVGGDGEDYCLRLSGYYEGQYGDYIKAWENVLSNMSQWRFNTIRLAFSFADCPVVPETGRHTHTVINYTVMDNVIDFLYSRGYYVILDCHNWHDMYQYCGSPNWSANWIDVATHYKDDERIIGYELFNEPNNNLFSSNPLWDQTWYPTIKSKSDLAMAFANLTDTIRSIDSDRTVIWADPMTYFQDTNVTLLPQGAFRENIIFAWHGWMGSSGWAKNYTATLAHAEKEIAAAEWWQQQYPSSKQWLGEFGMYSNSTINGIPVEFDYTAQRDYDVAWVNACVRNGWGFSFWLWSNQNSGAANYTDVMIHSQYKR